MESTLTEYLAPGAAIVLSILTLVLSQVRSQQSENRILAKDTVELLKIQNETLIVEIADLRQRVVLLEQERSSLKNELLKSEEERRKLIDEVIKLNLIVQNSTLQIRADIKDNTEISKAAFHEANQAKQSISDAMHEVSNQNKISDKRLDNLELR